MQLVTSGAVRGKPRISRTFHRLPRAVGSASVPAGDRAALVGSAEFVISLYSSSLITRNDRAYQSVTSGAVGASPAYPGRFTAYCEPLGRQAFPLGDRTALVGSAISVKAFIPPRAALAFPAPAEHSPLARFLARPTSRRSSSAVDTTGIRRLDRNDRNHRTAPVRNGAAKHNRRVVPLSHVSPNSCGRGTSAPLSPVAERTPLPAAARTSDPHSSAVIASDALPPTVADGLRCSARAPH